MESFNKNAHAAEHGGAPPVRMPAGSMIMYGGAEAPRGWLLCDGSAVSRGTYAQLFKAIGTEFGAGDGSTTFNLPDMRSRAPFGVGTYRNLGQNEGGAEAGRDPGHTHAAGTLDVTNDHNISNNTTTGGGADRATNGTHSISGDTGTAGKTSFPSLGVNFIIKT